MDRKGRTAGMANHWIIRIYLFFLQRLQWSIKCTRWYCYISTLLCIYNKSTPRSSKAGLIFPCEERGQKSVCHLRNTVLGVDRNSAKAASDSAEIHKQLPNQYFRCMFLCDNCKILTASIIFLQFGEKAPFWSPYLSSVFATGTAPNQ